MTQWEYRTVTFALDGDLPDGGAWDEQLKEIGKDGWELLAVSPVLNDGQTVGLVHHFRRVAEAERKMGFRP